MKTSPAASFGCRASLASIGTVLVLFGLWFHSAYQIAIVSGDSMLPTLNSGNLVLIDKRAYDQLEPDRDDIVVARHDGGLIVKRIVGLPGEEVEVKQGALYVNSRRVNENHSTKSGNLFVGNGKLLSGDFATLGDNRAISAATAVHPIVTNHDLLGKVVFVLQTDTL